MKVLQISAFAGWGCTGRIVYGIDRALVEANHESYIAWGRKNTAPSYVNTVHIGNKLDQTLHGLYARLTDHAGFGSKLVTRNFIKEIERINPDIVQLHVMHGYYINLEILFDYIKEKDIPVVWTFHDGWAFTGHCPCYCYNSCNKWKTLCEKCEHTKSHPVSWFIDDSKKNYLKKKNSFTNVKNMTIVTPSYWMANKVKESFFSDYSVHVIRNGINTEEFKPINSDFKEKYNIINKKIVLGVSSTWTKEKGVDDFIELSKILSDEYKIVMVGLSKNQIKSLPDTIIKIARTDNVKELAKIYSAADVFVNATYEDNYPTCNLEAISCGTPVITYDIDGSPESVLESSMGLVVPIGDVNALKNAIQNEIVNMKLTNKGLVLEQEQCFKKYIALYEEMCR